jgi:FkbM family methyltransferase
VTKATIQRVARSVGVAITRYPPRDSLGFHLKQLIERLSVNLVLDVGAHEGGYVRVLRKVVGYEGEIVSFEPGLRSFEALTENCGRDRRWNGLRLALGDRNAEAGLHLYRKALFNSLLLPNEYGSSRFSALAGPEAMERVDVRTLADVFDQVTAHVDEPRVHLKIDTQGFDPAVIRGATGVLDRVVSIQTEVSLKPIYDHQPTWLEAIRELGGLGYEVTGMFPVSRDSDGLRVIEFDCTLCRGNR